MNMTLKILQIRNIIKKSKSTVIFFDSDCDGATSYLQLQSTFPQCKGFPMNKNFEQQKYLSKYITPQTDTILFIDTPIINEELLNQIHNKKIIWIDHHPNNNEEKNRKYDITYLNPTTQKQINLPCAYLAYKITNDKSNLAKAVLGSISDFFLQDIITKLHKQNPSKFKTLINITNEEKSQLFEFLKQNLKNHTTPQSSKRDKIIRHLIYETNISTLRNFIETILKFKNEEDTIDAIRQIEKLSIEELLENINSEKGHIFHEFSKMQKEYKNTLKEALKTPHNNNLFFFEYTGKRGYSGALAQELNYKTCSKIICICFRKKGKDYHTCSIRGRDTNISELLNESIQGLKANGGGHKFAVGASIHKSDFETFKKRIFEKSTLITN
jgi:single-stranded DNA-specific DHH superfamily exonuclease